MKLFQRSRSQFSTGSKTAWVVLLTAVAAVFHQPTILDQAFLSHPSVLVQAFLSHGSATLMIHSNVVLMAATITLPAARRAAQIVLMALRKVSECWYA